MPISVGKIVTPETGVKIYINGTDYSEYVFNYEFKKKVNQIGEFMVELLGISSTQRDTDIKQDVVVYFESKGKLLFKGVSERPDYETGQGVIINGYGAGESYCKRRMAEVTASADTNSSPLSPVYTLQSINTILSEQLDNVSQVTLDSVDDGSELGTGTYRGDHVSILSILANPVSAKGGKWWFTHGNSSPWNDNICHTSLFQGSASSVKDFNISGVDQNASGTSNEQDFESLWNWTEILGSGDGLNQKRSVNFHATNTRSFLANDIDSSQTTIELEDASSFDSSGNVFIGMETLKYTSKNNNFLTGITRGSQIIRLFDDFSDGNYTADPVWTVISGSWVIDSDDLFESGFSNNTGIITDINFNSDLDCLWEFNLSREGSTNTAQVGILVNDSILENGYYVDLKDDIALRTQRNDGVVVISGGTTVANTNYKIKVTRDNSGLFELFLDDASLGTATNITHVSGSKLILGSSGYGKSRLDDILFSDNNELYKAYAHSKGIEVYDAQYTIDTPESSSSIDTYGLKQHSLQDKTIIDQDALDRIAQKELAAHKDLVTRISLEASDPYDAVRIIGVDDTISISDSDTDLSGDYRVVSVNMKSENGWERCFFECSNARLVLTEELKENSRLSDVESRFMQGSTSLFVVNETENAKSGAPIDVFFEIPAEAVAINQVKLAYRNEAPRVWHDVSSNVASSSTGNPTIEGTTANLTPSDNTDWQTISTWEIGTNIQTIMVSTHLRRTAGTGADAVRIRLVNSTASTNYPVSSGSSSAYYEFNYTNDADSGTAGGGVSLYWENPGSSGDTVLFQIASDSGNTWTCYYHITQIRDHTHTIDYNINDKPYTTNVVTISTTDDASGTTPTWTDRTTAIEAIEDTLNASNGGLERNIDLTDFFSSTGWKGVRFAVNGNSRHKIQVMGKVFIEAKKV